MNEPKNDGIKLNIEQMREDVDYAAVFALSNRIRNLANEAANLSHRLQRGDLSDEERNKLTLDLTKIVNEGHEISEERLRLLAHIAA